MDSNTAEILLVDGDENNVEITGLTPGTAYAFRVEAVTEDNRLVLLGHLQTITKPGMCAQSTGTEQRRTYEGGTMIMNDCWAN